MRQFRGRLPKSFVGDDQADGETDSDSDGDGDYENFLRMAWADQAVDDEVIVGNDRNDVEIDNDDSDADYVIEIEEQMDEDFDVRRGNNQEGVDMDAESSSDSSSDQVNVVINSNTDANDNISRDNNAGAVNEQGGQGPSQVVVSISNDTNRPVTFVVRSHRAHVFNVGGGLLGGQPIRESRTESTETATTVRDGETVVLNTSAGPEAELDHQESSSSFSDSVPIPTTSSSLQPHPSGTVETTINDSPSLSSVPATHGILHDDLPDYESPDEDDESSDRTKEYETEKISDAIVEEQNQLILETSNNSPAAAGRDDIEETSQFSDSIDCEGDERKDDDASKEEEDFANPMVSDNEDEDEVNEDLVRGDRIGNTMFAERHVLKILMNWIQNLPKYSMDSLRPESANGDAAVDDTGGDTLRDVPLEKVFGEDMAMLWDMSTDADVMTYLVEKDIFSLLGETIEISGCIRLTEISLGIMANLLSQPGIVEDFAVHDAKLKLVDRVTGLVTKVTHSAVLTQVFSVLRRVVWFMRNVQTVEEWTNLLLSPQFLKCASFVMMSSTNALLLGDVIMTLFTLLEIVSSPVEDGKGDDETKEDNDPLAPLKDTNFVVSLCEGLNELLKNPKPNAPSAPTTGTENKTAEEEFEVEIFIPPGHVQTAILNGLSALSLLMNTLEGKTLLVDNAEKVVKVLLDLLRKFGLCTETLGSLVLDYFAIALGLLSFCNRQLAAPLLEGVRIPVSSAFKIYKTDEIASDETSFKEGTELTPLSFLAVVLHEFLASYATNFGNEPVDKVRSHERYSTFLKFVDERVSKIAEESSSVSTVEDKSHNNVEDEETA